jgi:hypothetical protein
MALGWRTERIETMYFELGHMNSGGQAATERCRIEMQWSAPGIAGSRSVAKHSVVVMEDEQIVVWEAPVECRMEEAAEERTTGVSTAERSIAASRIEARRTGADWAGLRYMMGFDDLANNQALAGGGARGSALVHGQQLV